jgi:hypothetical protein
MMHIVGLRTSKSLLGRMWRLERIFGVLISCWAIVRHPARSWSCSHMWKIMTAYVIIHTMIIKEERDDNKYDQG